MEVGCSERADLFLIACAAGAGDAVGNLWKYLENLAEG